MPSPPFLLRTTGCTEGEVYWWEEALAEPQKAFGVFEGLSAPRGFFVPPSGDQALFNYVEVLY